MEALKKAYAEVILNMAKEAAARVMESEKKALKFQQDLHFTKEEALRMLLRLKLVIDAKTTEAESLSQDQQRRIDELEVQLSEAEGLIIDLRAELYNVHEQLNETKNKHFHHVRPHGKEDLVCPESIMAKSKLNKSESLKFATELGSKVGKSVDMSDIVLCNYSKDNHSSCKVHCNKLMLSQQPVPAISRSARYLQPSDTYYDVPDNRSTNTERKNVAGCSFVSCNKEPQNKDLTIAVARRSLRKIRVKYMDDIYPATMSHSNHSNRPKRPGKQGPSFSNSKFNAVNCTVESTKLGGEGGIEEGTGFQAESSGFTSEKKIFRKFACAYYDAHKDKELLDVSVMVEEFDGKPLLNFGILPVESVLGDAKAAEGSKESPLQGNNETLLKYTFSRKRKKDNLLNPNESPSPESSMKKRPADKENIDPRLQDSKSLKDSPLRSKQLMQVARQLISLSGRSWWQ